VPRRTAVWPPRGWQQPKDASLALRPRPSANHDAGLVAAVGPAPVAFDCAAQSSLSFAADVAWRRVVDASRCRRRARACRNRQVGSTPTRARASSSLSPATTYSSTSALSKTAAGWKQARPWSSTSLRAARAPRPPTCARSSPNSHPPALGLPGVGGAAACRPQHQRLLHGGRSGPTHRRLRSSARQQADELVGRLPVQTSTPAAPENSSSRRRGWGSDTLFDAYRRPVPPG
jgi:hypothetical protein